MRALAILFSVAIAAGPVLAAGPATRPTAATRPTTTTATAPATTAPTTAPSADPAAVKILKRLEAAGQKYKTIRADLVYRLVNRRLGDSETRTGWVAYQAKAPKAPAKFRVAFRTLQQGRGAKLLARVDFAFDGTWLTHKKHRIRQMTRYQLAAEGETADPLKLGKGPFPLPFGQQADDVLKYFKAATRAPKESDPKDTDVLELVTRAAFAKELNVSRMEVWVDRKTHLPVKVVSHDAGKNETTVTFRDVETDVKLSDDVFLLPWVPGWRREVRPFKKGVDLRP